VCVGVFVDVRRRGFPKNKWSSLCDVNSCGVEVKTTLFILPSEQDSNRFFAGKVVMFLLVLEGSDGSTQIWF